LTGQGSASSPDHGRRSLGNAGGHSVEHLQEPSLSFPPLAAVLLQDQELSPLAHADVFGSPKFTAALPHGALMPPSNGMLTGAVGSPGSNKLNLSIKYGSSHDPSLR
jgi:hypothetical protein